MNQSVINKRILRIIDTGMPFSVIADISINPFDKGKLDCCFGEYIIPQAFRAKRVIYPLVDHESVMSVVYHLN